MCCGVREEFTGGISFYKYIPYFAFCEPSHKCGMEEYAGKLKGHSTEFTHEDRDLWSTTVPVETVDGSGGALSVVT